MALTVTLITRRDCCLCDEMKRAAEPVVRAAGGEWVMRDVDADPDWQSQFGDEVPVLLINGRKAFKYRLTPAALRRRLEREARGEAGASWWQRWLGLPR